MSKYLLKRFLIIIPTFIGITMITYSMVRLAPGDYTSIKAGIEGELQQGSLNNKIYDQERKIYGLDKKIHIGYFIWLKKFLVFDLGISRQDNRPVIDRIKDTLPITLTLNILTIIIVYIISIPMGILAAVKKDSTFDRASSLIMFILYSLPTFWIGLLLILFFSSGEYLDIFPFGGIISDWAEELPFFKKLLNRIWHLVLPIVTLTYGSFAFLSRFVRANMLEVINEQYITTAKAKGLSSNKVVFIHAFRNSLIPFITLLATLLPALLGGSVIVEQIFTIPGMGKLAFSAITTRDIPVVMAITSISALLTLLGILISDLMYSIVDPRIRIEAKK